MFFHVPVLLCISRLQYNRHCIVIALSVGCIQIQLMSCSKGRYMSY